MMTKLLKFTILASTCFLLLISTQTLSAYTFRPQWVPQTQFAGYYMAVKKGYYRQLGLDLQIKDGGPGIIALAEISSNKITFGSGWLLSALKVYDKSGKKLVLIGQMMQSNALVLVTRKSSGIDSLEKFTGKRLSVWQGDFQIPPKAFIRMKRLKGLQIVQQGFDISVFFKNKMDIASAMLYNELLLIREKEKDVNVFNFSKMGMNIPEDGIYTNIDTFNKNPGACKAFIEGSIKGWKYAFTNKDETVKYLTMLAGKTNFKTTHKHQLNMLNVMEELIDTDSVALKKKDFNTAIDVLKKTRVVRRQIKYSDFVKGPAVEQ